RGRGPMPEAELYDFEVIELGKKPSRGFGFSIVGRTRDEGVLVSDIIRGGAAEGDGRLQPGDRLLELNGCNVRLLPHVEVATRLKAAQGRISMLVGRLKHVGAASRAKRRPEEQVKKWLKWPVTAAVTTEPRWRQKYIKGPSAVAAATAAVSAGAPAAPKAALQQQQHAAPDLQKQYTAAGAKDLTLYSIKFGINVPYSDVRRLVQTGARLLYSLKECSRAGRVNWKLRMRRCDSPDSNRSQPPSGRASDPYVSLYLKFEPQTLAESASCSVEFAVRLAGPSGRSVERRSAGRRQFDQRDSCRGWARFARASELEALAFSINGVKHLKLSGVLQVFDASQFLYPERRHNFARCQLGADFRLRVQLATFHVHRAVLALNSDYFAALLARPDSLESRQGQVVLSEDRIQDVHLMLQFMYPGYADVLDDETLKPLSRLAAKYQVHSLAWSCMQYIDSKLGEHPAPDAERISLYYFVCQESLQCPDLAEQCVRIAASLPWRGGLREARHFRELDETRKAAFLQAYLDFKDEMQFSTPGSEQLPTMPPPPPPPTSAVAKNASQKAGDNNSLSSDTGYPQRMTEEVKPSSAHGSGRSRNPLKLRTWKG
uniref:BTB domain-containing protein n=1 Tax=Macrostomum lignano TaxID=282301 RepID=A0A1I8FI00_9PLAT